ncbi:hypothetical protein F2Q69_00005848 [Brassica cretica]|uniref:Uncharacterized protein n=1 Tax=Brassica cretica TaxID=69181 RepID=A0A8S9NYY7_BRACR|nr:hypothetical protein F2Q69_00005848 [Brassica cretica]
MEGSPYWKVAPSGDPEAGVLPGCEGLESKDDNIPIACRPLSRRDEGGSLCRSVRATTVGEQSSSRVPVPQLVDEDVVDLEDDDEYVAANAPLEDVPPLQMRAPNDDESPWTPPPGWMCLYEAFFTHSRLWFPLPRLLTSYVAARDIALTQFTSAVIRNVVAALVFRAEVGIYLDLRFFEYILRGRENRAHKWFQRYFFVRIDSTSVADLDASLRGTWNPSPSESLVLYLSSLCCVGYRFRRSLGSSREVSVILAASSFSCVVAWDRSFSFSADGGVRQDIPSYTDVMKEEMTSSSLRVGNRGMAKSNPLNRDTEPERAFGESGEVNLAAAGSGEPGRESGSLKRPSEDIVVGDIPEEKRSRRNPNAFTNPDADDLVNAQEFKDMAGSNAQSKAHAVRLVYLYEKDLKRVRAKLEDVFAEKELCDNRMKELEVTVDGLNSAVETLRAELSASSSREAILRSQIGDQQSTLGARIDTLKGVVKLFFLLLLLCFVEINLFFLRDTLGFSGVSEVETRLSLSR